MKVFNPIFDSIHNIFFAKPSCVEERRFFTVIHYTAFFGFAVHLLFIALFAYLKVYPLALINIGSVIVWYLVLQNNLKGRQIRSFTLAIAEVVLHAIAAALFLGTAPGFHLYILITGPVLFITMSLSLKDKILLTALFIGIFIFLTFYGVNQQIPFPLDTQITNTMKVFNIVFLVAAFSMLVYYYNDTILKIESENNQLINELKYALENVKELKGLIPICASCKKIRDDGGYWHQVEEYIREHSDAEFSHGLCQECMSELYPGYCSKK
ncbi:MAG: hypothetical protein GF372_02835 [Candidatus Marinimicrobia bacterium]|nr:hypothetical protein [Candidatus Neomarinimicrobiota bacterium]